MLVVQSAQRFVKFSMVHYTYIHTNSGREVRGWVGCNRGSAGTKWVHESVARTAGCTMTLDMRGSTGVRVTSK